jgi:hypothetical protein
MSGSSLVVVLAAVVLVGLSIAGMAIGVMLRRPCLRGSCGGPELRNAAGERLSCATCPNRRRRDAGDRA